MSTLNPETWNEVSRALEGTPGGFVFDMLFGTSPEGNTTQAYMDEQQLAYLAWYMQQMGVFNANNPVAPTSNYKGEFHELEGDSYTNQLYYKNAVESAKVNYPDITFPIYTTGEYVWESPARNALEVGYIGYGSYYATNDTEVHVEVVTPGEFVLGGNPNGAVWKKYNGSIIITATNV